VVVLPSIGKEASDFALYCLSHYRIPLVSVRSPHHRGNLARFHLADGLCSGLLQVFASVLDTLAACFPDHIGWILDHWGQVGQPTEGFGHWPTDATRGIHPVNCHSHNDEWRRVPLYEAIHAGCIGVEADAWLVDNEIYVGHRTFSLTANRTLKNLYINPLVELLEKQNPTNPLRPDEDYPLASHQKNPPNGVFDTDPFQTFVLLVDFKSSGPALWWQLYSQLAPLRDKGYLTYFNGTGVTERPVTVVGTGNAPFDFLTANNAYRDVFFDAPLIDMADMSSQWPNPNRAQDPTRGHAANVPDHPIANATDTRSTSTSSLSVFRRADRGQGRSGTSAVTNPDAYNTSNSYYASTSFTKSIGHIWGSRLTQEQLQLIRGQIRGAHARGLKVRYWSLPSWPRGLRNHVWHILMREGVDILNVDDLRGATGSDWRRRKGWYY
jgi:hypothetical protein